MLISYFPTQYVTYPYKDHGKGVCFTVRELSDVERVKKYVKSLTRGGKRQAFQIICAKEYKDCFPDFDFATEHNGLVLLFQYF